MFSCSSWPAGWFRGRAPCGFRRLLVEGGRENCFGRPAGYIDDLVGFEAEDVAQHDHGFISGDEAQRGFQPRELIGRDVLTAPATLGAVRQSAGSGLALRARLRCPNLAPPRELGAGLVGTPDVVDDVVSMKLATRRRGAPRPCFAEGNLERGVVSIQVSRCSPLAAGHRAHDVAVWINDR
jgi:hypothetical protein